MTDPVAASQEGGRVTGSNAKSANPNPPYSEASEVNNEPTSENDMLERYIVQLDQHIADSWNNHLGLSQTCGLYRDDFHGQSTIVGPFKSIWCPIDKSAFFASLSRHSRFRPDLIAQEINKTEGEVLDYLDLLGSAEKRVKRTTGGDEGYRDRSKRWKSGRLYASGMAPGCIRPTQDWIGKEEELSNLVVEKEGKVEEEIWEFEMEKKKQSMMEISKRAANIFRNDRRPASILAEKIDAQWSKEKEVQEWGRSLDRDKLEMMDRLINAFVDESEAKASNSVPIDIANTISDGDAKGQEHAASPQKGRRQFGKLERMILDDKAIDYLEAIPLYDQSKDHKQALKILSNRRRMRRMKRSKALKSKGMTDEVISLKGGVDAIYLDEHGMTNWDKEHDIDLEFEFGPRWWAFFAGLDKVASDPAESTSDGKKGNDEASALSDINGAGEEANDENVGSEGGLEQGDQGSKVKSTGDGEGADRLGIGQLALSQGWDIFDHAVLAKRLLISNEGANLTFTMLDVMREELRAYLIPLIYQVITLAEQNNHQKSSLPPSSKQNDADSSLDAVTSEHVQTILALRDRPDARSADKSLNCPERAKYLKDSALSRIPLSFMHVEPPGSDLELEGADVWSDAESTKTDEEDLELDQALDKADEEMDDIAEKRLWSTLDGKENNENARKTRYHEIGDTKLPARMAYENLLLDTMRQRRWRRAMASRSTRSRRVIIKLEEGVVGETKPQPQALRYWRMAPIIVDSDDEPIVISDSEEDTDKEWDEDDFESEEEEPNDDADDAVETVQEADEEDEEDEEDDELHESDDSDR